MSARKGKGKGVPVGPFTVVQRVTVRVNWALAVSAERSRAREEERIVAVSCSVR